VDPQAATGVTVEEELFEGETAAGHDFSGACFEG
jgi:hypothetical protein